MTFQLDPRFVEACREFNRVLAEDVGRFFQRLADEMKKVKMPPVERWFENRRDYERTYATWRKVPGGRASHAFYDGCDVPLCGVQPVRADGRPSGWKPESSNRWGSRNPRHRACRRLAERENQRRGHELIERQRKEVADDRTNQL